MDIQPVLRYKWGKSFELQNTENDMTPKDDT